MTVIDTHPGLLGHKLTVEEFIGYQISAVKFLAELLEGKSDALTDEQLKARVVSAQTLISCEPPLDTDRFLANIREQLHAELAAHGIDVEAALADKPVVVAP